MEENVNVFENSHIKVLKNNHEYAIIDKRTGYTIFEIPINEKEE